MRRTGNWLLCSMVGVFAACTARTAVPEMGPAAAVAADATVAAAPARPVAVAPSAPARRVVLVSIDGLRSDVVDPESMPTLVGLRARGASTLNARPDPQRIYTLPNHICMVTGLPAEGRYGHHFTGNRKSTKTVHDTAGRTVATVFDVVHRAGRRSAIWASKRKLDVLSRTPAATTRAPDEAVFTAYDDAATLGHALAGLRGPTPPAFALVHFAAPDATGHRHGFDPAPGSAYRQAVRATDTRLATLVAALGPDAALIVTTDHGGSGDSHGDASEPQDYTIPLVVVGGGAAPATDLYALNAGTRRDPVRAPAWGGEPVRNCEAGNLALRLIGLPPVPGSVYGARADLRWRP